MTTAKPKRRNKRRQLLAGELTVPKGKPSLYRPEHVELARRVCTYLGATTDQLADVIGVSEDAVKAWMKVHPELREAVTSGKMAADGRVAERLYARAMGWEHEAVKIFLVDEVETIENADGSKTTTITKKPLHVPYIERVPPDTTAATYWLNNRQKSYWRPIAPNHEDGAGVPASVDNSRTNILQINLDGMNAEQRDQLRQLLRLALPGRDGGAAPSAGQG